MLTRPNKTPALQATSKCPASSLFVVFTSVHCSRFLNFVTFPSFSHAFLCSRSGTLSVCNPLRCLRFSACIPNSCYPCIPKCALRVLPYILLPLVSIPSDHVWFSSLLGNFQFVLHVRGNVSYSTREFERSTRQFNFLVTTRHQSLCNNKYT